MLLLAAEEGELPRARAYAAAVGGVEADLRADAWLADDLAGGFLVDGCFTVDAMSATAAAAEAARRAGARFVLGCEAKRILLAGGRVAGLATDLGIVRCGRIVVAAGPRLRFLLRTAGADLPVSASRGWLLETGPVEPPPVYAIEQAAWPEQAEMGAGTVDATLGEIGTDAAEEPALVSLLLGGRPAGHCLIGTSLSRSLLEEPEGPETIRRLAAYAPTGHPSCRVGSTGATGPHFRSYLDIKIHEIKRFFDHRPVLPVSSCALLVGRSTAYLRRTRRRRKRTSPLAR